MALPNVSRFACLTVDLDPVQTYLENRNLTPAPDTDLEAVIRDGLPRFLNLLSRMHIPATFFALGRDARDDENARWLRATVDAGHEVASHSDRHLPDFNRLSEDQVEADIARSQESLEHATRRAIAGFRAPAWNIPQNMFSVLAKRKFRYDSSLVARPSGPFRTTALRLVRTFWPSLAPHRIMQGQPRSSLIPAQPYPLNLSSPGLPRAGSKLWEIPHGCSPGLIPVPLNATILQGLPFPVSAALCRMASRRLEPLVFVCHGLDLVDFHRCIRDPRLRGKPGLTAPTAEKERRLGQLLQRLGEGRVWLRLEDLLRHYADNAATVPTERIAPHRARG